MQIELTEREEEFILGLRAQAAFDRGYNSAISDLLPRFRNPEEYENVRGLMHTIHESQQRDKR